MMQTKDEVLKVANSWKRPAGLQDTEENGAEIAKGIDLSFQGVWSHANLDAVVAKLGSKSQGGKLSYNERVVVVEKVVEKPAAIQSAQEAQVIRAEWWKTAPKNLPYTAANDSALAAYIQKYFGGLTNRTSLQEAFDHAALKRLSAEEIKAEAAKKERERMQRDILESYKPQPKIDHGKLAREAAEKEKWVKGQEASKKELDGVIGGYSCNAGPNRVDHAMSEMVRAFLKRVRIPAPAGKGIDASNTDYVATVEWVRAIILELPDHPSLSDPERATQRVREKFAAEQVKRNTKDRNQGW